MHFNVSKFTRRISRRKIRGQGMTEYVIIVALIAIAAIGVYSAFGNVIKGQTGAMAAELGGKAGTQAAGTAKDQGTQANTRGQTKHTLENFTEAAGKGR
jgi:type IV pilus assembly protein PilA